MPISWDQYGKIRKLWNDGISLRGISDELHINRATVTKYAAGGCTPSDIINRNITPTNNSNYISEFIKKYIEEHTESFIGKQKLNIASIYRELKELIPVSYMTVNRYYHNIIEKKPEIFIKLDFNPGEVMQVDWYDVHVRIQNQMYLLHVFDAKLPNSGMFFSMVMPDMTFNSFVTGHVEAFNFFGGVTGTIIYDNLKTAVYKGAGLSAIIYLYLP